MATILLLGAKVPFSRGGQDVLVASLMKELRQRGHEVDLVELPFSIPTKGHLLTQCALWRSLDLTSFTGKKVDLVIPTKFPSYYARHPKKSLWLVHQLREIYDLHGGNFSNFSDDPRDEELRRMLADGDSQVLNECAYKSTISHTVTERLKNFNGIDAETLYPPLSLGNRYRCAPAEPYILSVGRLLHIKRVDLMIKALPIVHHFVKLKIVGAPDAPGIMEYYKSEIDKHHLWDRVEFVGRVSDEELIDLYARALGVYYAPYNEDYGYVTLEAMASHKPVITAHDSGGVLEFINHGVEGLIAEPTTDSIGHTVNQLVDNQERARTMGEAGYAKLHKLGVFEQGWNQIIDRLLSPLELDSTSTLSHVELRA
jgi:glycosyltransferase involved in cell wall biosynthesis